MSTVEARTYVLLPPELERLIFIFTAQEHFETFPTLLLVARRTYEWLEPLRYSALNFDSTMSPQFLRLLSQKDSSFLETHLSSILLDVASQDDHLILSKYTGAMDVVILNGNHDTFSNFTGYARLRKLSLDSLSSKVFSDFLRGHPNVIFPTLTHLDVKHSSIPTPDQVASQLPSLSHFMIYGWPDAIRRLPGILRLDQIYLVIILDDPHRGAVTPLKHWNLVRMRLNPLETGNYIERNWWERKAGRMDFWDLAEKCFKSQRSD
ncbi:hypothetical protein DL96DRAFT_1621525 [Flagelloscypha sp. PMI_526]|nr:hypothetical protein DL96DRAFT_1621525 [Flagelloscypha sp. PMI_526]